ncbi:MAG TPA: DUF2627 domain-containing protein [Firmicutes bacterium]|jgi:hypothetical protein|nr:DUF2627 domain-containing protein [Bacillota bacterium]
MNLSKNMQQSFSLYQKNFALLVLASLIAGIITLVSLGILAGPMLGGILVLGIKLIRGEKGELSEIFAHFDQFLPTLMATFLLWGAGIVFFIIGSIPLIGWITNLVASPVLFMLYFLAIGFIVEQKLQPIQAIKRGIDCLATEWAQLWLYSLVMMFISGIGSIIFGVGVILTIPLGMMGMVLIYQELSEKEPPRFKPEKQMLQKAGIALTALLVIGVVCLMFGFGRNSSSARSTGLTSKILSGITGQNIEIDQKGSRFKIGNLSFGSGLPENFPKDIPIYPHAEVDGFISGKDDELSGSTTTLTSKDSAVKIYDYYLKSLEDKGWSITPQDLGEIKMISFQKGKRSGVITINPGESQCDILIGITTE